ncbi:MAG: glycosyltransferase [Rhizobiaceae bacterium]|nr:glycosyltransferase [Rhizobiaceae bacterium]
MQTDSSKPAVSVVVCFRDWGLDKLLANVKLHLVNSSPLETEVIVSDYGSAEPDIIRQRVEEAGGRVVRSNTAHMPWSRAAALNAGVEAARGEVIITTDADILFSPQCYFDALDAVRRNPDALYLVQCRDLPSSHDVAFFENILATGHAIDFEELDGVSTLRPRWGMGGFAAFGLEAFFRLNGLDERMKIWGAEDSDFAKRFRLNRMPVRWMSRNGTVIFHVWHESSQKQANENEETRKAVNSNKRIYTDDHTPVRNLRRIFRYSNPLISIVIPAYRRPEFLRQTLQSCQAQTFSNFEVIVVENGDSDVCAEVCQSFADPRFRYIKTGKAGASAARNIGNSEARGRYIVIQDDDDMMVSTRLESHLAALNGGRFHGTYCGWIDFNEERQSPEGFHPGKEHSFAAMLAQGRVIVHAGLMIESSILRSYRYDESRSAGIDFALLFFLSYQGLRLAHTRSFGLLRRIHDRNMTSEQSAVQKESAVLGVKNITQHLSKAELNELRKVGKQASLLSCDNTESAVAELNLYFSGKAPPAQVPEPLDILGAGLPARDRSQKLLQARQTQERAYEKWNAVRAESGVPRNQPTYDRMIATSQHLSRRLYAEESKQLTMLADEVRRLSTQRDSRHRDGQGQP